MNNYYFYYILKLVVVKIVNLYVHSFVGIDVGSVPERTYKWKGGYMGKHFHVTSRCIRLDMPSTNCSCYVMLQALGCLLFRICYFKNAFDGESKLQILNGNYRIPDLPKYSSSITNLIKDMLQASPVDRPDITQASTLLDWSFILEFRLVLDSLCPC